MLQIKDMTGLPGLQRLNCNFSAVHVNLMNDPLLKAIETEVECEALKSSGETFQINESQYTAKGCTLQNSGGEYSYIQWAPNGTQEYAGGFMNAAYAVCTRQD